MDTVGFELGPWYVDLVRQALVTPEAEVSLSTAECALLRHLATHRDAPVPRTVLQTRVLGYAENVTSRALDQSLLRLRKKLARPGEPNPLHHKRGVGVWLDGLAPIHPTAEPTPPPGRSELAARVQDLLGAPGLVTLTGVPGIGKTELARFVERRSRGVWIDCHALHHVGELASQVAHALGVQSSDIEERLRRGTLLVLDNFEQLDAAAAVTVDAWARHGRVLVTSISPLRVPSEQVVPVPPLDADTAVQVLSEQVSRLGSSADPRHVRALAGRVGGHPLALLLLAPSVHDAEWLSSDAVLDLVSDRPTEPERHRTLRTAIDRATSFLTPETLTVLRAAACFEGTFRADAVAAVAGSPVAEIAQALRTLVRHGLVRPEPDGHRLPPVVRMRLAPTSDPATTSRRDTFLLGLVDAEMRLGAPVVRPYMEDLLAALEGASGSTRFWLNGLCMDAGAPRSRVWEAGDRCGLWSEPDPDAVAAKVMVAREARRPELQGAIEALSRITEHTPLSLFEHVRTFGARPDFDTFDRLVDGPLTPTVVTALIGIGPLLHDPRVVPRMDLGASRCAANGWWSASEQITAAVGGLLFRDGDLDEAWRRLRDVPLESASSTTLLVRSLTAWSVGARSLAFTGAMRGSELMEAARKCGSAVLLRAAAAVFAWLEGRRDDAVRLASEALAIPDGDNAQQGFTVARLVLGMASHAPPTPDPPLTGLVKPLGDWLAHGNR